MSSLPSVLQLHVWYFEDNRRRHLCHNLIGCGLHMFEFTVALNQRRVHLRVVSLLRKYELISDNFYRVDVYCQHYRHKQVRSIATSHIQFIQSVINKFRDWFCNSERGRSWEAPLCSNVALSLLSPRHKGRPETVRQCLFSFGRTSTCTWASSHFGPRSKCLKRRNSVCESSFALNLGKTVRRLLKR
jgi:hypothetical protein